MASAPRSRDGGLPPGAVAAVRVAGREDRVVVEEPLEIRVAGDTFAVTMRTPGHDRELVLGYLFAEGVIRGADDVSAVAHCGRPGDEGYGNTIEVTPAPGVRVDLDAHLVRRGTTTSACGVCGRRTIDDLLARFARLPAHERLDEGVVTRAVRRLDEHQPVFSATGGCHAASLVGFSGEHVATFEDVGRHNAVDKVVGARLLAKRAPRPPLAAHVLVVSGRASFEIVQKAMTARIPVVAAVSAPTSLAVTLAARAGITLAAFVRGGALQIYAGALERGG